MNACDLGYNFNVATNLKTCILYSSTDINKIYVWVHNYCMKMSDLNASETRFDVSVYLHLEYVRK